MLITDFKHATTTNEDSFIPLVPNTYQAPEVVSKSKSSATSDVFSVAAIFYELIKFKPIFPNINFYMELIGDKMKLQSHLDLAVTKLKCSADLKAILK